MKKAFKLISAAALVAATATAAVANDVPLNTTVAGGQGTEQLQGQGAGTAALFTAMGTVSILTIIAVAGASSSSSTP